MTKPNTRVALAAALLLAAASCGKAKTEAELREEVLACSRVNSQAELIALCLESDHKWADSTAAIAGRGRAHELDSIFAWQQDSAFNVDAAQHRQDIRACSSGDVIRDCLKLRGWPDDRAARAADSLWRKDLARHLVQARTCAGQRREPIASCLELHYRWSSRRALATQDSIQRARMTR